MTNLQPVYADCPIHGAYLIGRIDPHHMTDYRPILNGCPKCAEERRRRAEEAKWRDVAIPRRFQGARLEDFQAKTPEQMEVLKFVTAYGRALQGEKVPSCGLVMHGRAGTGKTMLAAALAILAQSAGHSSRFVVMSKLLRAVTSTWSGASELTETDVIERYASVDFLVIDEVARARSETINDIFFSVCNERYERMLPTVLTTNASQEAPSDFLEDRTLRRIISGGGMLLDFNWEPFE